MQAEQLGELCSSLAAALPPDAGLASRLQLARAAFGSSSNASSLSQLYELCEQQLGGGSSDGALVAGPAHALTAAAVAFLFLQQEQAAPSLLVVRQFARGVFLPLAAALQGSPGAGQVVQQLAHLLAARQAWELVLEAMQCVHSSLEAALQQAAAAPSHSAAAATPGGTQQQQHCLATLQLPPLTACVVASELAAAAVAAQRAGTADGAPALQAALQLASGPLFASACGLLTSAEPALRRGAFQQLLPALLDAADAGPPSTRALCLQQLWRQCLQLVAQPAVPRRMGLSVLLQYSQDWGIQPPTAQPPQHASEAAGSADAGPGSSASASAEFWALLRCCLVDVEPLNRKRAMRLLQLLLPEAALAAQPAWGVLLTLYELLDEFAAHLVKSAWPLVSQLHPAAPEFADEDADADVARSSNVTRLERAKLGSQASVAAGDGSGSNGMAAAADADGLPLAFCWSSVVWTLALQHGNTQVQRMALRTFLKRHWTPAALADVPVSWVVGVVLPALMNPVQHKVSAAAGGGSGSDGDKSQAGAGLSHAYANTNPGAASFNTTAHMGAFLQAYLPVAGPEASRTLLAGGLALVASPLQELPRAGLLAALQSIAVAAEAAVAEGPAWLLQGLSDDDEAEFMQAGLGKLHAVLGRLHSFHGIKFRATCASLAYGVAAAVAPAGRCSLPAAARLVQAEPAWLQSTGGALRARVRAWLLGSDGGQAAWLAQSTSSMWRAYLAADGSQQAQQAQQQPSRVDYVPWRISSDAWLRVVLSCGDELQQQLSAAVDQLADLAGQLSSRSYLQPGLAERVLLMLVALLEGAEAAARAAADNGQPPPALVAAALQLAEAAQQPLCACLQLYCCCYASSPAELAGTPAAAGEFRLSPAAWAAAARAETAAQAAGAAALLLGQHAADAGNEAAKQRLLAALLSLQGQLVALGSQLTSRPLQTVQPGGMGGSQQQPDQQQLRQASAVEQARASALKVLCHVSLGLSRSLACCPELAGVHASSLQPVAWLEAVLAQVAATRAAHSAWLPAASAASSGGTPGHPLAGWAITLDWRSIDALLTLAAVMAGQRNRGSAAAEAGELPAGVLPEPLLFSLVCEAVEALSWAGTNMAGGDVLQLLRVLRRLWSVLVASGQQTQEAAVQALQDAGVVCSSSYDSSSALAALAGILSNSLLDVLRSCKKRPLLLYVATVNALALPQLFVFEPRAQPQLLRLHQGAGAPLRRFVQGLLQQGCKGSPRLLVVLALQLAAFLTAEGAGSVPVLLGLYGDELRTLVLFGVAGGNVSSDTDMQQAPSVEEAQEAALLAAPLERELQDVYALTDIGPRVAVVCGLHQLAVLAGLAGSSSGGGSEVWRAEVEAAGVELWNAWLQATLADPQLSSERYKVGSEMHRLKVRAWQGLVAASTFLTGPQQRTAAVAALQVMLGQLALNNPPSVKQFHEAIAATLLLRHTGLLQQHLLPLLVDLTKSSPFTGSLMLVAVQTALHSPAAARDELLPALLKLLLPWCNIHNHNVRTFAQLGVSALLDAAPLDTWPRWREALGQGGADVAAHMVRFLAENADFQRFKRGIGEGMAGWSPVDVTHPRRIFSSQLHLAGAEETPVTWEGVPESLMDCVVAFLAGERRKVRAATAARLAGYEQGAGDADGAAAAAAATTAAASCGGAADFQRKVTPRERVVLLADMLEDEAGVDGSAGAASGTVRGELVLVASLISKVPNLGGLARSAEIFGAGALVLSDLRVTGEQSFTSVSVTAERHVPLVEVKEEALLGWLSNKRADGYTLVGLEQTAESTPLPAFVWPRRSVLVLGREKEGLPAEIISMLDAAVEIPQCGVIRSLNVHVSGAIAMFEYAKQHTSKAGGGSGST